MVLRHTLLFVLLWNCPLTAQQSIFYSFLSTENRGTGKAGICSFFEQSSIANPAFLGKEGSDLICLESQNYFLVQDLYAALILGEFKSKQGGLAFHVMLDGSLEYKDLLAGIAYGRKLSALTSIGLELNCIQSYRPVSKNVVNGSFCLGLQSRIMPALELGFVIQNPIQITQETKKLNHSIYKLGLAYLVNAQTEIRLESQFIYLQKHAIHCGLRYGFHQNLVFLCGFNTLGPQYSFGLILKMYSKIKITSSFENHLLLGWSPSIGFLFSLD